MRERPSDLPRGLARVAIGLAVTLSMAGIGRLGFRVPVVAAIDCQPDTPPVTADDPGTPADPAWSVLEDGTLDIAAPGFLANDLCTDSLITMGYTTTYPFTLVSSGRVLFVPDSNFYGTAHTDYSITGPGGQSNTSRITVTVIPVNDKPNWGQGGICEGYVVAEDGGPLLDGPCVYEGDPGGGTAEAAAQTLTMHASSSNPKLFSNLGLAYTTLAGGTVTAHLTFFLAPNANGSATVTVWVTDNGGTAHGGVDTSTKYTESVTVTPVDDPPVANNDAYATAFGQQLSVPASSGVLKNDTDIDGPALTATRVSGPSHGVLVLQADGAFIYTPTNGFSGKDSFSYHVGSAGGDEATATITVAAAGATVPPASAILDASAGPSTSASSAGTETPAGGSGGPDSSGSGATQAGGASPGASAGAPGTAGNTGSDLTPWLLILLIAVVVVVGANVAIYQVRRGRPPKGDAG